MISSFKIKAFQRIRKTHKSHLQFLCPSYVRL
jgi:hypothetical protein